MDILRKYILVAGILLCGIVRATTAFDQVLTSRHLIWCALVIVLVVCTKEIRVGKVHLFILGYLGFALFSGFFAINKSEWLYWVLRIVLMVSYLSVVEIDKKLLSKAMILLGLFYAIYFWYDYSQMGRFAACRGLMRQRNYWAAAQFFIIPFCYYVISKKFWRFLAIPVLLLMVMNIILLGSRSALLAVFVSAWLLVILNIKRWPVLYVVNWKTTIPLTIFTLIAIFFIRQDIAKFFTRDSGRFVSTISMQHRLVQWKPTITMIAQNPFGVGVGNWQIEFPNYAPDIDYPKSYDKVNFRFPHNDFLWVGAEVGVGGLVCYLGIFVTALYYAWKKKAIWITIFLVGYMTIAFFSNARERPFATLMLMTFFAMALQGRFQIYRVRFQVPILIILIFAMVVFGYRFNSARWEKKLKRTTAWYEMAEMTEGYSVFSTLTTTGQPWHWWWGVANFKMGNEDLAAEQFKQAYKYNPFNVRVINGMGLAMIVEGKNERAKGYFKKALKICPTFEYAQENLERVK